MKYFTTTAKGLGTWNCEEKRGDKTDQSLKVLQELAILQSVLESRLLK